MDDWINALELQIGYHIEQNFDGGKA